MNIVVVTGSRYGCDELKFDYYMRWATQYMIFSLTPTKIVSGECSGIDNMAKLWSQKNLFEHEIIPARWKDFGKKAGPMRNILLCERALQAIREGFAACCIAFPRKDSIGTWDCVRAAVSREIPCLVVPEDK